jgi:hypothetical protein
VLGADCAPAPRTSAVLRVALACVWALVATPFVQGRATAQEAVWTAGSGDQLEPWYAAAREALEADGVAVVETGSEHAACSGERGREVARTRGMAHGLCVDVEQRGPRTSTVVVRVLRADGESGEGRAEAEPGGIATAVRDAYRQAEIALALGNTGLLRLRTTPQGALVRIDGEPAGHAPLERRLSPGAHRIEVALDGFEGVVREVHLVRGHAVDLHVALARAANAPARTRTEPSPLNYILGGSLIVAAVPALAISLAALAGDGDCARRGADGGCLERVRFGARSGLLLGAGVAALIGGGVLLFVAPFEIEVQADAQSARATFAASF